jgi:hypothetical protein
LSLIPSHSPYSETAAPAEAEAATEAPAATEEVKEEKVCVPAPITHYVPLTLVAEGGEEGGQSDQSR